MGVGLEGKEMQRGGGRETLGSIGFVGQEGFGGGQETLSNREGERGYVRFEGGRKFAGGRHRGANMQDWAVGEGQGG